MKTRAQCKLDRLKRSSVWNDVKRAGEGQLEGVAPKL